MKNQNREKYAYLEQLTTRQLEELLLADLDDDSGRDTSEVVFHILEVLREREKDPAQEPDVDQAWERFQTYYNTPEGEGQALYPCVQDRLETHQEKDTPTMKKSGSRFAFPRRGLTTAAAVVALLFALMLGVQASGHDIFGALAQWTSETFHFGNRNELSENYELFLGELAKNKIPKEFAPTLILNDFEASEPTVKVDDIGTSIQISFSDSTERLYFISFDQHSQPISMENQVFEKDTTFVESYVKDEKVFYIFSNISTTTALWANPSFTETIWGEISTDEIKEIINSIGG